MSELAKTDEKVLTETVGAIRFLSRDAANNILQIGRHLLNAKKVLGSRFPGWVHQHFAWTMGNVAAFIRVAAVFAAVPKPTLDRFEPTALYLLADKGSPPAARESALTAAEEGQRITHTTARELVQVARGGAVQKPPRKLKDSTVATIGTEERPEERMAWQALEMLALDATVRVSRIPDTDEEDNVARPWVVHVSRPDREPEQFVCKDSLASALTLAAGTQPTVTCKTCGWSGPAFHSFSRKTGGTHGRSFNCRACETWRVGTQKKINRGTAQVGELPDLPPTRRGMPETPKDSPASPPAEKREPSGG